MDKTIGYEDLKAGMLVRFDNGRNGMLERFKDSYNQWRVVFFDGCGQIINTTYFPERIVSVGVLVDDKVKFFNTSWCGTGEDNMNEKKGKVQTDAEPLTPRKPVSNDMKEIEVKPNIQVEEATALLAHWLERYTHEVIVKVMERSKEIINNESAIHLLRELKEREEKESKEFATSIGWLISSYKTCKDYNPHNHPMLHGHSYRDILYDMYIR